MYKILIADDEEIERNALKLMLARNFTSLLLVGDAANGIEAVEIARDHRPDIILMDIKMPGIDGLKAIREIKALIPAVKILVVSAFSDFEYAQKALQLGVEDYLLKPVTGRKLLDAISTVIEKIDEECRYKEDIILQKNKIQSITPLIENDLLYAVIAGERQTDTFKKYASFLETDLSRAFCIMVLIDQYPEKNTVRNVPLNNLNPETLRGIISELVNEVTPCLIRDVLDESYLLLVPVKTGVEKPEVRNWSKDLAVYIKGKIRERAKLQVSIGIGDVCEGYENLHNSYIEALNALKVIKNSSRLIIHFAEMNEECIIKNGYPFETERDLCEKLTKADSEACNILLNTILENIYQSYYGNLKAVRTKLYELVIVLYRHTAGISGLSLEDHDFYLEINCIKDFNSIKQWIHNCIENMISTIKSSRQGNLHSNLSTAVNYINNNFTKDLTLEEVAYEVNVSSFYLSKLFKQKLNKNFIEYITEQRINKAIELLRDTNKSIKEITYLVGYNNQTYFCKVFKKVTGISATEYREKNCVQNY